MDILFSLVSKYVEINDEQYGIFRCYFTKHKFLSGSFIVDIIYNAQKFKYFVEEYRHPGDICRFGNLSTDNTLSYISHVAEVYIDVYIIYINTDQFSIRMI